MVRAAAWVGQDSQDRAWLPRGRKSPGGPGAATKPYQAGPGGAGTPTAASTLPSQRALSCWTTRRYGNHTWMTTPISKARAEEGQVPKGGDPTSKQSWTGGSEGRGGLQGSRERGGAGALTSLGPV